MSSLIERNTTVVAPSTLPEIVERARDYGKAAKADNTRRAYASDWEHFAAWCGGHGLEPLPASPGTVAAYLTDHAGSLKVSTLGRRLAAIRSAHQQAGTTLNLDSQAFKDVWKGIRREHQTRPNKKRALVTADLRKTVTALPESIIGIRDRALLLVGFASALRRSELAALVIGDGGHSVTFTDNGLLIELGKSKTDQEAQGVIIGVPFGSHAETCPVRALKAWLEVAGIEQGCIFRPVTRHGHIGNHAMSTSAIATAIKRAVFRSALAEGLSQKDAYALADTVAGHSLRAGFITAADAAGAPISKIMEQARHARFETTRGYIRKADAFRGNAASYLGL
jgi:site-specific recombinase XerD